MYLRNKKPRSSNAGMHSSVSIADVSHSQLRAAIGTEPEDCQNDRIECVTGKLRVHPARMRSILSLNTIVCLVDRLCHPNDSISCRSGLRGKQRTGLYLCSSPETVAASFSQRQRKNESISQRQEQGLSVLVHSIMFHIITEEKERLLKGRAIAASVESASPSLSQPSHYTHRKQESRI